MFKAWILKGIGALAAVGILGASGSVALAQGTGTATNLAPGGRLRVARAVMQEVTSQTGLDTCDVGSALAEGQTLAQIIEDAGVSTSDVVDSLMADLQTRLDEAVANGRITQDRADTILSNSEDRFNNLMQADLTRWGNRISRRCNPQPHPGLIAIRQVSQQIGLTPCEIGQSLADGQTLEEIITNAGSDPSTVVDALLANLSDHLDQAVANGHITQDKADEIMSAAPDRLNTLMSQDLSEQAGKAVEHWCATPDSSGG